MNTISLVLNGRTAADIYMLPERQKAAITSLYTLRSSAPGSPVLGPKRPQAKRQISRESPGWYHTEGGMTLDDFARRLDTTLSRVEQWQTKCAQNIVMALMRPTPLVIFLFNPLVVLIWIALTIWWYATG